MNDGANRLSEAPDCWAADLPDTAQASGSDGMGPVEMDVSVDDTLAGQEQPVVAGNADLLNPIYLLH